jgi:HEAT repeat protein
MSNQFKEILNQIATDKQLQTSKLFIFSKMDLRALDIFQEVWPTILAERRREVIEALVEIAEFNFEVDFSPVFLLGLKDENPEVRAQSVGGLWINEDPALIGPFIHLLKADEVPIVRAAAASSLGQFVYLVELEEIDAEWEAPIRKALLDTIHQPAEDVEVRRRAVEAISFFGGPEIIQIIENAYYDDNEKMQISAVFAMGRNADVRWRSQVMSELDNANTEIRFEAARACGELEIADAVPLLVDLIENDPDLQVQEVAIWALGRIGGNQAQEALEICADSEIEAIASAAEEALDEINLFGGTLDLLDFDEDEDFDDLDGYERNYRLN